jgi:hypothetical protein
LSVPDDRETVIGATTVPYLGAVVEVAAA